MRIYAMRATFGKLDQAELVLEEGLNVIQAPNEWGKSTWCAFLLAMFYGLDTRAKSTKTALADKERYAPWSGKAMEGSIDLCWQGRDITIERTTQGRIPMGVFRAYETKTGLPVPELTAENCGAVLLGVEQSVFRRAGFVRLKDMPVTQDEALRRRLNDLVTTGDESGQADRLAGKLREQKNKCRYNRTGLIPQTEEKLARTEQTLRELASQQTLSGELKQRLDRVKESLRQLENHRQALEYAAAEENALRVARAGEARDLAEARLTAARNECEGLPSQEEALQRIRGLTAFREDWTQARIDRTLMPERPRKPELPRAFQGMTLSQARQQLKADILQLEEYGKRRPWRIFVILAVLTVLGAVTALLTKLYPVAAALGALTVLLLILGSIRRKRRQAQSGELFRKYGSEDPALWEAELNRYEESCRKYEEDLQAWQAAEADLDIRMTFLQKQRQTLCPDSTPEQALESWQQVLETWQRSGQCLQQLQQARKHLEDLKSMARPVMPPALPDSLDLSAEDTENRILQTRMLQQQLLERLGQCRGRMESLGNRDSLEREREALQWQLASLESTYDALELALTTLEAARQQLQRRFAPRISGRAGQLLKQMTAGRYDRLTLNQDLSVMTAASDETVLQEALRRSDGTVDQLYFALRLAVAEELMPGMPLVLDDVFVRFDDQRLREALKLLRDQSETRQILLFTCQSREKQLLQR